MRIRYLLLALTISGCSEKVEKIARTDQGLVFGERNVLQVGDSMIQAGRAQSATDRQLLWESAMLGNATAKVVPKICHERGVSRCNPECPLEFRDGEFGSATMSSHTRAATAHHVTRGFHESKLRFGSPFVGDIQGTEEENWLLPNRLWALGMGDTASQEKALQRESLRSWEFDQSVSYFLPSQGLKRDAVILEPNNSNLKVLQSQVALDPFGATSIDFSFYAPGLLYDYFPSNPPQLEGQAGRFDLELHPQDEVWLGHYNDTPPEYDVPPSIRRQLTSLPGYLPETTPISGTCALGAPTVVCTQEEGAWKVAELRYEHCALHSADDLEGSSGGAVAVANVVPDEVFFENGPGRLLRVGMHQGGTGEGKAWSEQTDQEFPVQGEHRGIWAVDLADFSFDSGKDFPLENPNGGDEAFTEGPWHQPGTGVPDGCAGLNCSDTTTSTGSTLDPDHPKLTTRSCRKPIVEGWHGDPRQLRVANGYAVGVLGENSSPLPFARERADRLGEPHEEEVRGLASFEMVCTAWSSAPWSINWQDLFFVGWQRPGAFTWNPLIVQYLEGSLRHELAGTNLSSTLPAMYELREADYWTSNDPVPWTTFQPTGESFDRLAPASMLMCPPGTALQGINAIARDCNDLSGGCLDPDAESVVKGIESIECVQVPFDNELPFEQQTYEIPASPHSLTSMFDGEEYIYSHNGKDIIVEAQLGTPLRTSQDFTVYVGCEDGPWAVQEMISNVHDLETTALGVTKCMPVDTVN